jgi:N-acetylglucosamine malate deacetylase 2
MKKVIFGIFAHPDDEAFGPSGTILTEVGAGSDVHLITITAGEAGENPDHAPDLAQVRLKEWQAAGTLMGVTSMQYLGYPDSHLDNTLMIEIGKKIEALVTEVLRTYPADTEVEFLTFEPAGISGHIDHIVAARAACWVFYRLKPQDPRFSRLRLFCIPRSLLPNPDTSWIFMDQGFTDDEINEVIDVDGFYDQITAIVKAHHTQRQDAAMHLERMAHGRPLRNHFIVRS